MTSRNVLRFLFILSLSIVITASNAQTASPSGTPLVKPAAMPPTVAANYSRLPLNFEPNLGQTSSEVQWLARGADYTLFLAGHDAVLELNKITPAKQGEGLQPKIGESALRMNLVGARTAKSASGEEPLPGKANYFTGKDSSKWQRDVPMYGRVRLQGVYPGINLAYYGRQGQLEYDFIVAAGADASAIRLKFDGATAKLAANGDLILPVAGTEVRFDKPVIYQMKAGVRQPVDGSFTIADNQQVSFKLGAYDHSRELIIDPTLLFLGTLGTGNQQSVPNGMAVDSLGEIILTGITNDLTFPTTTGALQPSCTNASAPFVTAGYHRCGPSSASSGFVTKISADGTSLLYSTYLHGLSGQEYGDAVATDAAGDAYVLGATSSNDFPITTDAYQSFCQPYFPPNGFAQPQTYLPEVSTCDGFFAGGGTEFVYQGPTLFIAKLNPSGSSILYSTFFGGTIPTYPVGLALDSSNNIYFASYLQNGEPASNVYPGSSNVQFPVTANAYQSAGVGVQTATLSKLSADGHTLLYSTLMGGVTTNTFFGYTQPLALAVGQNGMAYIGGLTLTAEFPTTPGVVKPNCVANTPDNGDCIGYTGFLSAFDTTQSGSASLVYSTYIGGTETAAGNSPQTQVNGLAADSSNNVYVTGFTSRIDYPTTPGAYQTTCGHANAANACGTAFLTKINPAGTAYVWSTYYGGTTSNPPNASGSAIALDAKGRVYLYGLSSGGGDIPQVNPVQPWIGGDELFIAAFSPDASQLLFATYVGDTTTVVSTAQLPIANNGVALDASGNIYFAGETNGIPFVTTPGTYATTPTSTFFRGFFGKISPIFASDSTTLTISPSTATVGQSIAFSAKVAGTTQTPPVPTGTVTLTNVSASPSTVLGTITLDGTGAGTLSTTALPVGTYSVTATYSGDGNYDVSTSSAQALTVNGPVTTTTTLTVLPGASLTYGQSATLTSTVTQTAGGVPTGTVTFTEGNLVLGTVTLNGSGLAMLTNTPPAGIGTFIATYNGSSPTSSSSGVPISVARAVLTVTANNASMIYGQPLPAFSNKITGFVNGDLPSVVGGTATETTAATSTSIPGPYPITFATEALTAANYTFSYVNGTLTISGGATQTITFNPLPNQTLGAAPFTLTATASSGLAVSYTSTTTAACTVSGATVTLVATGTCIIQAKQLGNNLYAAATPVSQSFTVLAASNNSFTITPIPAAETINRGVLGIFILQLNSVNGFNGNVTLSCSGGPAGAKCTDFPQTVKVKGTAYALSGILFPNNSTPGTYIITFTGVSGSLRSTATAKFTVK
jgi:Bacterial Ig-like domain (group 3)/MBG domain (YGX type)/Beta-propeller repeat